MIDEVKVWLHSLELSNVGKDFLEELDMIIQKRLYWSLEGNSSKEIGIKRVNK